MKLTNLILVTALVALFARLAWLIAGITTEYFRPHERINMGSPNR